MKHIKYCLLFILASLFASCDPNGLEIAKTSPEKDFVAPVMKAMSGIDVSQENYDGTGSVAFSWQKADFGTPTEVKYDLYMSSASKKDVLIQAGIYTTSFEMDYKTIYAKFVGESNLALPKGASSDIECYVQASLGNLYKIKSQPITIKADIARISTGINMLYVSGDFNNNHPDRNGIEERTAGKKNYEGLVHMKYPIASNNVKFLEYTYSASNEGIAYGGADGVLQEGGPAISAPVDDLCYVKADLENGTYSFRAIGSLYLAGWNGSWRVTSCPELKYNAAEDAWISDAVEYKSGNFRPCNTSWVGFGPKDPNSLKLTAGSDVKIYHQDISKPIVGGDPNMSIDAPGSYVFKMYYESADATWHLVVNVAK